MNHQITYLDKKEYLLIIIESRWTPEIAEQVLKEIKHEAEALKMDRLFFDVRKLELPGSESTRFLTGEFIADMLRPPIKVAALGKPEAINRFVENTAVNRGANFKVFSDEQKAINWLMG